MQPDGFHHFIEWQLTKCVIYCTVSQHWISLTGDKGAFILKNIVNQCCHRDCWLHWWIGLRLFMEFAQNATWWLSPLYRITTKKGVLQHEVCQHWISITGGKRDLFSAKYWKSMLSLWLLIALLDRVKVFMEFAQDATWWFSPLHRMTKNKICYILYG
jgi:hypothetical protein